MSKSIKYAQRLLLLSLVTIISACAAAPEAEKNDYAAEVNNDLAVIYGFDIKPEGLWFLVKSTGCTSEKNFNLQSKMIDDKTAEFSLYQSKRDLCRGMPQLVGITMEIDDSGAVDRRFVVVNPIAAKPKRTKR